MALPDAARSNTVKQLDRRNRGNLECKYMLFLVQISMQMHTPGLFITIGGGSHALIKLIYLEALRRRANPPCCL